MQSFLPSGLKLTLAILSCTLCTYQSLAQTTSVVTNNLNTGPGSLRNAIAEANADASSTPDNPHQITFAATVGDIITISSPFLVVTNHVNIVGPGKDKLVISGGNTTRIFWLQNGNIAISNLTLGNGYAQGGNARFSAGGGGGMGAGGAIFMHEGRQDPQSLAGIISGSLSVRLINVDFKNNRAAGGFGGQGEGPLGLYPEDVPFTGSGGGMGGSGSGGGGGMGAGGGVIGNGSDYFGGSVTSADNSVPGSNGGITIFGEGGGENPPGFGGGGSDRGYPFPSQAGNFGGGGAYGSGGGFGGGGGVEASGGFGGGGGGTDWYSAGRGGFGGGNGGGRQGYENPEHDGSTSYVDGYGGSGMGAGGAIFVASGNLLLSNVSFINNSAVGRYTVTEIIGSVTYSLGLGGAVFIFNKQDNNGQQAPGTTHDPVVSSCGALNYRGNFASGDTLQPGLYDDNLYGAINIETVEIVDKPHGQTVDAGSNVTASVTTSGSVVTYQWYKDGVSLGSGQRTATLTLSNVTQADAGRYKVVVKGNCKDIECSCFVLKVKQPVGSNELKLQVMANPSSTSFNIMATSNRPNKIVVLQITDVTGRVIEEKNATILETIQIGSSYRPGFYIIKAIQGDKTATLKIIKQ